RGTDAAKAVNEQGQRPEISAVPNRKCPRSQWCVGEPAYVGRVSRSVESVGSNQAEIKKQATESGHPETESIQTWKGHIPRPDHEWDEVVGESEQDRHDHEENHGGSMHGEHSVEDLWRNKVVMWTDKLDADDGRFDPADQEKNEGITDVQNAQPLVIDGRHPFVQLIHQRMSRCLGLRLPD